MMKVKLLKSVLVGRADVIPTKRGTLVDLPDDEAKEFIANGLAAESEKARDVKHDEKRAKK